MNLEKFFETKPKLNIFLLIIFVLVAVFSKQIDLFVSNLFYDGTLFPLYENKLFYVTNHILPAALVALAGAYVILYFFHRVKKETMLLVTGSMLIGPLLIVNGIFKSFWGRARPMNITEFSGDKDFSSAFIISDQCHLDCSFVSGHTAVAMWTLCLALICPKKYQNIAITISFLFTIFVAFTRVVQGYHFFSDIFFSAIINFYVVWVLYYYVYLKKKTRF